MFDFSLPYLQRLHDEGRPFFAAYLTSSDHGPYVIPEGVGFQPRSAEVEQQIVEYADWSIGEFMNDARQTPWFDNTIFVFIADHGANRQPLYELSLSYLHVPLIIHAPFMFQQAERNRAIGGQYDVYPTILGLLNIPYVNNTMGIDLLRESRPYIYFNADRRLGCLNEHFFWIRRPNGDQSLYRYAAQDLRDYAAEHPDTLKAMHDYAASMIQTTQWLISNKKVAPIPNQHP